MAGSVREIARKSGFSVAAVSKTLNSASGTIRIGDEARRRILEAARELRYLPNNNIGLIVTPDYSYLDPLTARVLQGVQIEAQIRGSQVLCSLLHGTEVPQLVRESCVGGVIFLHQIPAASTELLDDRGIPYVVINPDVDAPHDRVICDDHHGMTEALTFLREKRCKRLAFVWDENSHPSYVKRRAAFLEFAARRKVEPILFTRKPDAEIAARIAALLKDPEPIGFVIFEELLPLLLNMIGEVGRKLGQSVHVVTINDLISALFVPPVTSVRVPFLEMGREAVRLIGQKWDAGHKKVPSVHVKPTLIQRESKL
jgi:DNA-binding LacI/PurR family transcriptional regulator